MFFATPETSSFPELQQSSSHQSLAHSGKVNKSSVWAEEPSLTEQGKGDLERSVQRIWERLCMADRTRWSSGVIQPVMESSQSPSHESKLLSVTLCQSSILRSAEAALSSGAGRGRFPDSISRCFTPALTALCEFT